MTERRDVARARAAAEKADRALQAVAMLPGEVGAVVRWPHNGVTWQRVDEDGWRPIRDSAFGIADDERWSSSHIADAPWEVLDA